MPISSDPTRLFLCRRAFALAAAIQFLFNGAMADTTGTDNARLPDAARAPLMLELPLLDMPDNFPRGPAFPSMQQSLRLTASMYQAVHRGIDAGLGQHPLASELVQDGFDLLSLYLPLGESWLHEEWHRAVLSSRGINSFDEIYKFNFLSLAVKVSGVGDSDLVRLKRDHPQDLVRLYEAGVEAQYLHARELSKDRFFFGANRYARILNIASVASGIVYLGLSTFSYVDRLTDQMNASDGANVLGRDVAGWDFTAWVYDLYRPHEPYEARGIHPSGVGINRYIKTTDLTADQIRFLRLQAGLSLLNLADPVLYGSNGFGAEGPAGNDPMRYSFSLHHFLTSFGYSVDATGFFKHGDFNGCVTLHNYANGQKYFPGLELEALQYPLFFATAITVSPKINIWLQPLNQDFWTASYSGGGLAALKCSFPVYQHFGAWVEIEGKTGGWVAGDVHLGPSVGGELGISYMTRPPR